MRESLIISKQNDTVIDKTKYNKSVSFIIPMLGHNADFFYSLMNCYLGDSNKPEYNFRRIFLQNKYKDDKLKAIPYYESEYKLDDSYMYVYHIPEQFQNDYVLFCEGKYSEFSQAYKDQLCRLLNKRDYHNTQVYKIIYKTPDRKKRIEELVGQSIGDQEVCSKPNLDLEIYQSQVDE